MRKRPIRSDQRYTITREWCGYPEQRYVLLPEGGSPRCCVTQSGSKQRRSAAFRGVREKMVRRTRLDGSGGAARSVWVRTGPVCSSAVDAMRAFIVGLEPQLAQGFSDDYVWPEGVTKTDIIKAIGNSVSCGVAEALTLAWHSQNEDISHFFEDKESARDCPYAAVDS